LSFYIIIYLSVKEEQKRLYPQVFLDQISFSPRLICDVLLTVLIIFVLKGSNWVTFSKVETQLTLFSHEYQIDTLLPKWFWWKDFQSRSSKVFSKANFVGVSQCTPLDPIEEEQLRNMRWLEATSGRLRNEYMRLDMLILTKIV